jgi:hypothetical protein
MVVMIEIFLGIILALSVLALFSEQYFKIGTVIDEL